MNTKIILLLAITFAFSSCMGNTQTPEASGNIIGQIGETFLFQAFHMNETQLASEQNEMNEEREALSPNIPDALSSASGEKGTNISPSLEKGSLTKNTTVSSTVKTKTLAPVSQTPIIEQEKINIPASAPQGVQYPEKNRYEKDEDDDEEEYEDDDDDKDYDREDEEEREDDEF